MYETVQIHTRRGWGGILALGGRLEQFIKHFIRETGGVWVCVEGATLDTPQGRIQVTAGSRFTIGTKFMNLELARMLDEAYSRQHAGKG